MSVKLYPIGSVELGKGQSNYIEVISVMSKVISPQDSTETLAFDSAIEIIQRQNDAGRRSYTSIPGNYIIGSKVGEPDSTENSRVVITKPLGANMSLRYISMVLIVLVIGFIIVFVLKIKDKKGKKPIIYK